MNGNTEKRSARSKTWLCGEFAQMDYREALELQHAILEAKTSSALTEEVVLLLEHPPVFTLGRRGNRGNLLVAETFLKSRGVPVVHVERGGDITYHGLGQLIAYPIVELESAGWKVVTFVGALEEIMIRIAADFEITAGRDERNRGVWVGHNKLGSVGIAIRHGVSFHGLALNVNVSLDPFTWINPCGLAGVRMTSFKALLGRDIPMEDVRRSALHHMQEVFKVQLEKTDVTRLLDIQRHEKVLTS